MVFAASAEEDTDIPHALWECLLVMSFNKSFANLTESDHKLHQKILETETK